MTADDERDAVEEERSLRQEGRRDDNQYGEVESLAIRTVLGVPAPAGRHAARG
jgi:hypothetical protein